MSNLDTNGSSGTSGNSCEFYYYQVFYEMWRSSFTKSSDPLVLFFHYCLTRNRYKCLINEKVKLFAYKRFQKLTLIKLVYFCVQPGELLPPEWNKAKSFYQLTYRKNDIDFKLEITIIPNSNLMHVQLRVTICLFMILSGCLYIQSFFIYRFLNNSISYQRDYFLYAKFC